MTGTGWIVSRVLKERDDRFSAWRVRKRRFVDL